MARERTAEDCVADVRKRANLENSDFVTDEEILEYLNQEFAELRGRLRMNEGQVHEVQVEDIVVRSGTEAYDLPPDFWELLSIHVTIGGRPRMLDSFMEQERADLLAGPFFSTVESPRYRLMGKQIEFLPATQDFTATVRYAPNTGRLRLGQTPPDKVDGYNGYEVAAIYGAVAICNAKEETDPSFYLAQKDRILKQIDALAARRDAGRPERVTDVTGGLAGDFGPFGWW